MKHKIVSTAVVLALFFGVPLLTNPRLIWHPCILLMIAATLVVWLTQPAVSKADVVENRQSDRHSIVIILAMSALSIMTQVFEFAWRTPGPSPGSLLWSAWQWTGLAVIAAGIGLRVWAIRTLGDFFTSSVRVQAGQRVVTGGPYAFIRHPSYLGAYLAFLGCGLLLESWIGTATAAVAMGVSYILRIQTEEKTLIGAFGVEYADYQRNTWRMLPGIW